MFKPTVYVLLIFVISALTLPIVNAQSEQGFTVTSVSLSNILHPGQSASQTQWLVTIVLNGGGQSLVGSLGNSTINYQGFTSVYPLQISGSTNLEKAYYQIYNTNPTPVYTFTDLAENGTLGLTFGLITSYSNAPACPSTYSSGTYVGERDVNIETLATGHVPTISRVCIYEQAIGYESQISATPNIQSSSTLQLSANGQQEILNINYSQQSATSTDGLVQANWVGSLVTGNSAPGGNLYVAISNPQQSSWNVQSQSAYSSYTQTLSTTQSVYSGSSTPYGLQSLPQPCGGLGQNANLTSQTPTLVATCLMNNVISPAFAVNNQGAQSLLSSSVQIGNSQAQFVTNNGQSSFLVTLNNNFVNSQEVTLRMSGSFIGVVIPEGTPKIISATSSPFNSGNNGTIVVNVENVGTATGSFYTSLSNCSGIQTTSSPKYSVPSGQSQIIDIPISTSTSTQVINEQCIVTVTDYNGGGSSGAQVNVQSKPANQCTPNTSAVEGDYICPCVSVTGVYQTATGAQCTSCPYGVVTQSGSYTCAAAPPKVNTSSNSAISASTQSLSGLAPIVSDILPVAEGLVCSNQGTLATAITGLIVSSTGVGTFVSGLIDVGAKLALNYTCSG